MPFRTFCDNKGCKEEMAPVIDKKTLKVYCSECKEEINSVDEFMKRQLISMGQVRKADETKMAYAVVCPECKEKGTPKLGKKREIICSACEKDITDKLSGPFVQVLRGALSRKQ